MSTRKSIIYALAGLMLLMQVFLIARYAMFHNLAGFDWVLFAVYMVLIVSIVIDPLGEHTPKMTRIGYIKLALLLLGMVLIGFNLGRVF